MNRRSFITLLGSVAAAWPLAARAQQRERMRRVGALMTTSDAVGQVWYAAFLQGLQQSGWEVGRNVRIDTRWTEGSADKARKSAAELVALAPDVILAAGSASTGPLLQATRSVPIVFVHTPVRSEPGLSTACRGRAAPLPVSLVLSTVWGRNGWSCSSKLRRT